MSKFKKLMRELRAEEFEFPRLDLIDDELTKAIVSWPYVSRAIDTEKKINNPWDAVTFEVEEWADLAGLNNVARMKKISQRLMKLKMIFPDGTIAPDVRKFLGVSITKKLGLKFEKKKKEKPEKKESEEA